MSDLFGGATNIADVEIVPGFRVPPSGEYKVDAEFTKKTIKGEDALILEMEIAEEKTLDDGAVVLKGDKFTMMFNANGIKYNRDLLIQCAKVWECETFEELLEAGTREVNIVLVRQTDTKDSEKHYARVKSVSV